MKIKGLRKAVGEYKRANVGGYYSPRYGYLMYDKSDGELWCDEFYSLGHNQWKVYHDTNIINLGAKMVEDEIPITMQNVKNFIYDNYIK